MNDFTKEQLKNLRACLDVCISDDDSDDELMHKLDTMIDKYCEHTPSDAHYEQFRWHLCRKCGVQYK